MSNTLKIGLIGLGAMGRTHFSCYQNCPDAEVVAIADTNPAILAGDWGSVGLNLGTIDGATADMSRIATYADWADLINDPTVEAVDVTLPTPLHATVTIAALEAGKHVFCEKPMARSVEEARAMRAAAEKAGKQLMIGHCLRYWPQYTLAEQIIRSGEFGAVKYARFNRFSAAPLYSANNWLMTPSESGGAILDMHVHDIDTALWYFGQPDQIIAQGPGDFPGIVDATWKYENGPVVQLSCRWDTNGGDFSMAYYIILERATLEWDSSRGESVKLWQDGKARELEAKGVFAYQAEINDFAASILANKPIERVTPSGSIATLEVALEELRQITGSN